MGCWFTSPSTFLTMRTRTTGLRRCRWRGGEVGYPAMPVRPGFLLDIAARTGDRLYYNHMRYSGEGLVLVWRSKEGSLERAGIQALDASISPDGRSVADDNLTGILSIRDLGPSPNVRSIPVPGKALRPRWSDDGQRIRFGVRQTASDFNSLWEVRRDGSDLHRLPIPVEHGKDLMPEGWTADGRYFVFSEHGAIDGHSNLWIVADDSLRLRSAKAVRLTGAPMDFRSAVAAPDDSALFAIGTKFRSELARFDLEKHAFAALWEGL